MPRYDDGQLLDELVPRLFAPADRAAAVQALEQARAPDGGPLPERVGLAVALLSEGDPRRLEHFLRVAALDTRDVLWWAFERDDEAPARMRPFLRR